MIKEAYVSYEIAKLLKEKGFNEPCIRHWDCDDHSLYGANDIPISNSELRDNEYNGVSAPTHQMACAWLRKKHFIIVVTPVFFNVDYENSKWGYDVWADDNLEVSAEDCSKPLATYEEATEEALKYVLKNLL
jgi:hypothetical protein